MGFKIRYSPGYCKKTTQDLGCRYIGDIRGTTLFVLGLETDPKTHFDPFSCKKKNLSIHVKDHFVAFFWSQKKY